MNDDRNSSAGGADKDNSYTTNVIAGERRSSRRSRWLKRTGAGLAMFLVLLAVLVFVVPTYAARWVLASTLEDLGIDASGVETIEIDLWNREVSFGPVSIAGTGSDPAVVDRFGLSFSASQMFDRRGFGKQVIISGVSLDIVRSANGDISVNGIDIFELANRFSADDEPAEEGEPWGLGIRALEIRDSEVRITLPEGRTLDVDVAQFVLSGFRTWQPQEFGLFQLDATLNEIDIDLEGQAWPFAETIRVRMSTQLDGISLAKIERVTGPLAISRAEGTLRARLDNELVIEQSGRIAISHDGRVEAESLDVALPDGMSVSLVTGIIRLDSVRTVLEPGSRDISGSIGLAGSGASVTISPDAWIEFEEIALDIKELVAAARDDLETSGSMNARLEVDQGHVVIAETDTAFSRLRITTDGSEFSWTPDGGESWSTRARVNTEELEFRTRREGDPMIVSLGTVDIDAAGIDQTLATSLNSVLIETFSGSLSTPEDKEILRLRFDELSLSDASFAPEGVVRTGDVVLSGLDAMATSALLETQARGTDVEFLDRSRTVEEDASGEVAPSSEGIKARVGNFRIADAAQIELIDDRFSPATTVTLAIETLELENIDTADPEARVRFLLSAAINEFARLGAEGWIKGIIDPSGFELKSDLERLELPAFSPYAAKHLGMNLEKGRLSATVSGEATEGILDVRTDIEILNLEFSPLSEEDVERLSASAGVPVGLAVDLLEDPNGLISLSIPIQGNIDNPDFELSSVINKAVGNAIASAVSTTIKLFFPPALLISLVSSDNPGADADFASVPFDAGAADIQANGQELLGGMAKLLQQRPRLTVTVCGRTTSADLRSVLNDDIQKTIVARRAKHDREMTLFHTRIQPFVSRGISDSNGRLLVSEAPDTFPDRPKEPTVDETAIMEELAAARADSLRSRLTDLAAERTRAVRRMLRETEIVDDGQIAECRPVYEPANTEGPHAIVAL